MSENNNAFIVKLLLSLFFISSFNLVHSPCPSKPSQITHLPNLESSEWEPCMYSGLVEIDKETSSNIFYWLVHSQKNIDTSPFVVWLNGGPGHSSLFGLFSEMGPLRIKQNDGHINVEIKDETWSSLAHLLFVDQPIGTGYSFTQSISRIPSDQDAVAKDFYDFLQKFFADHHELLKNNLYIAGESYAGKYIPNIAKYILDRNEEITKNKIEGKIINLKKIYIGNGLIDPKIQREARRDLAMGLNILSENEDEVHIKFITQSCEYQIANKKQTAWETCNSIIEFINEMSGDVNQYDVRKTRDFDKDYLNLMHDYLNLNEVVESIHVKDKTSLTRTNYWSFSNSSVENQLKDDVVFSESKSVIEKLLDNYDLPILILGGEFDLMDGPQGLERVLLSMNYKKSEEFKKTPRSLWKIKKDSGAIGTVGYVKQSGNLVFITAKNSGHFFPRNQLRLSMRLLQNFFSDEVYIPCPDNTCDLTSTKCKVFDDCNQNGFCDSTTNGVCKCKEGFYGPDCKSVLQKLSLQTKLELLPGETKIYDLSSVNTKSILNLNFKDADSQAVLSLIGKSETHYLYNFDEHFIKQSMIDRENSFFVSEDLAKDYFLVIHNEELKKAIFTIEIKEFDFHSNSFWGPGGFGFFLTIFLLISGFGLVIFSYCFYKKYKQTKSMILLENNSSAISDKL